MTLFLALAVFSRQLPTQELQSYLLAYSASMWAVAALYQWQKNAIFREGVLADRLFAPIAGSLLLMSVAATLGWGLASVFAIEMPISALLYAVLFGATYVTGACLRQEGRLAEFYFYDTAFGVVKWIVAIGVVLVAPTASAAFWGLSCAMLLQNVVFLSITWRSRPTLIQSAGASIRDWAAVPGYVAAGMPILLNDLASNGIMYVDRFFVGSSGAAADYIIYASVANQLVGVVMGALVMVAYPRVAALAQTSNQWVSMYWRYGSRFWLGAACCVAGALIAGPVVLALLKPGMRSSGPLLTIFVAAQLAYYLALFSFIPLLLRRKATEGAVVSLTGLLVYFAVAWLLMRFGSASYLLLVAKVFVCVGIALRNFVSFIRVPVGIAASPN